MRRGALPVRITCTQRSITVRSVIRPVLRSIVVLAVRAVVRISVEPAIAIARDQIIEASNCDGPQHAAGDDGGHGNDRRER